MFRRLTLLGVAATALSAPLSQAASPTPTFFLCRSNVLKATAESVRGKPVVSVMLNESGKASLEQFTTRHLGEQTAIAYADATLVETQVLSPISSGFILVRRASSAEAEALARRLTDSAAEVPCGPR